MSYKSCEIPISTGKCQGDCCGPVPIANEVFERNRGKMQTLPLQEIAFTAGNVLPITANMDCVFLKKDFSCAIYEERPQVCKDFGSGHPSPFLQCPHGVVTGKREDEHGK